MEYRELGEAEISGRLLDGFERRQKVVKCWRKLDGVWAVAHDPFIDQWSGEERAELMKYSLIIVSSVPVMILYPFVQKHFVKGVTVGAVKG